MSTRLSILLAVLLALAPVPMCGTGNWNDLKLGMTAEKTLGALGTPLLRTTGRGFETWIYDNGAEILVYGTLIGWTAPAMSRATDRSGDIWKDRRGATSYGTFLDVLPALPASRDTAKEATIPGPHHAQPMRLPHIQRRRS